MKEHQEMRKDFHGTWKIKKSAGKACEFGPKTKKTLENCVIFIKISMKN